MLWSGDLWLTLELGWGTAATFFESGCFFVASILGQGYPDTAFGQQYVFSAGFPTLTSLASVTGRFAYWFDHLTLGTSVIKF